MFSLASVKFAIVGIVITSIPAFVHGQAVPVVTEIGNAASTFTLADVTLTSSRWQQNEQRTLNYLKFVDTNRLLYVFRATHKLSTNGAAANGGWDAPTFPFRSHMQGHILT
jgi:hypothetical protein